jgi:nitroreductase
MNATELESALRWRYATKQFDPKLKISSRHLVVLEDSLVYAPSSYGLQPWKFLMIENSKLREKLRAVSWNQSQVTEASHYLVMLYKEKLDRAHIAKFIDRTAEVRGMKRFDLEKYEAMMAADLLESPKSETIDHWAKAQTYIAMGFLLQTAAMLKIDSCPMEGLDGNAYDELLNLKGSGFRTLASVALGYRDANDRYQSLPKVRFPHSEIIEHIK